LFDDHPPFPGIPESGLRFLRELKANNDRAWFKPRKQTLEDEVIGPLQCLIADFSRRAAAEGVPLSGDPKKSIFRIYRDTRFSSDKTPYKTHVGAVLSRSGERGELGVVYIHIEPAASFVGSGFWRPPTPYLRALRERIVADPDRWLELVEQMAAGGLPVEAGDPLKRMPAGTNDLSEHPVAPWLKGRSFSCARRLSDDQLADPSLTQIVLDTAKQSLPLLNFGWAAADG